jgi:hypothetical protein
MKTTYIFWADSVTGLTEEVEVQAYTFKEAKQKLLKIMYIGKTSAHATTIEYDAWGNEIV